MNVVVLRGFSSLNKVSLNMVYFTNGEKKNGIRFDNPYFCCLSLFGYSEQCTLYIFTTHGKIL